MKLIPDWKESLKYLSVKWNAALVVVSGLWLLMPADMQANAVQTVLGWLPFDGAVQTSTVLFIVGALGLFFRLKAQPKLHDDPLSEPDPISLLDADQRAMWQAPEPAPPSRPVMPWDLKVEPAPKPEDPEQRP